MPDKPAAEIVISEGIVRELLQNQFPAAADRSIRHAADGWDCSVWRIGDDLAARLPRRSVAAPLVRHEQQWLPAIAERLAPTGIAVPAPLYSGVPAAVFPWSWSIVPWIDGEPGLVIPRPLRSGWAAPLAAALRALHTPAPDDHPRNPFRGVPLADRADAVAGRMAALQGTDPRLGALERAWTEGVEAAEWSGPPVWIHGDLHPGNLVAQGSRLAGIIDFGDITAGDPAYDLSVAWLAFDEPGRAEFIDACGPTVDTAIWARARAWAASVTLMLLAHSDDNPPYAALGRDSLAQFA